MFSGKGGVGKTTLSCGFARYWARQFPNEKILLLSTDPAHSLGDVLQMVVEDTPHPAVDQPNLHIRALDAEALLQEFKAKYGSVLELLVERGSFVQGEDLTPVWDLSWPGLDELMGILEIQRLLRDRIADRVVVDMAPSGHSLNLFGLMDFLDGFLAALELFQEKHRVISQSFTGRYVADTADEFLAEMKADLAGGRQLLQDASQTACLVVAIAEPMSFLETQRFLASLQTLQIPCGGLLINRILPLSKSQSVSAANLADLGQLTEQQQLLSQFLEIAGQKPIFTVPQQAEEPTGANALDHLIAQLATVPTNIPLPQLLDIQFPEKIPPGFSDFLTEGRQLILVGGKGGVGKTTVAAAIAYHLAAVHSDKNIRVISIDPAHSLGDALGLALGHQAIAITPNLSGQEIDAEQVLEQFREDYLWELAEMMSGESADEVSSLRIAYGPEAWRKIVSQALPGIDEMLSLVAILDLLDAKEQDLIILDTAPTGHLLRFLEMPMAMSDWLAWIFKLWIKYQDVLGRTDLMGRLRNLRQRVVQAQKKLKDPRYTEFIGVMQNQQAILAEAKRLSQSLTQMGVSQRYIVHNRFVPGKEVAAATFPDQTIIHLPNLPRAIAPLSQIAGAAHLLF